MSRENAETAHRILAALSNRKLDALTGLVEPDARWRSFFADAVHRLARLPMSCSSLGNVAISTLRGGFLKPRRSDRVRAMPVRLPPHDPTIAYGEQVAHLLLHRYTAAATKTGLPIEHEDAIAEVDEPFRRRSHVGPGAQVVPDRDPHIFTPVPLTLVPNGDVRTGTDAHVSDVWVEELGRVEVAPLPVLVEPAEQIDGLPGHGPRQYGAGSSPRGTSIRGNQAHRRQPRCDTRPLWTGTVVAVRRVGKALRRVW